MRRRWPGLFLSLLIPCSLSATETAARIRILYPFDGAVFPRDLRSPTVRWEDPGLKDERFRLQISFGGSVPAIEQEVRGRDWTPSESMWNRIKAASLEKPAVLKISGPSTGDAASVTFTTSRDPVGAPLFYRLVPLPFPREEDFVKIKWKLAYPDSYQSPITVMEDQTTCFNCHAISLNGKTFGMKIGSSEKTKSDGYLALKDPGAEVRLARDSRVDWNGIFSKKDQDSHQTMLSSISPDGDHIVTAGKSKNSFSVKRGPDFVASTLLTKGILLIYSKADEQVRVLPGASDEAYAHVSPTSWSGDGKFVFFSRALIPQYIARLNEDLDQFDKRELAKLSYVELDKRYPLKYDLYRVPFNRGLGGEAVPIEGASRNGKSNYYAKASPDGRWIAFTQSANGIFLMRPDSEILIVPSEGGKAKKIWRGGPGANSWHSWSPNSRWLAYSSKAYGDPADTPYGPYADIVLTHIDENGDSSPAVILTHLRAPDLSANLPEFFPIGPKRLQKIVPKL